MAEIDPALVASARSRIPSLQHGRRFELSAPGDRGRLRLVDKAS
jgi:predicted amidohydrolase